ncbi:MAG: DUF302 domain-containing protein [Candidatus Marinimicrobia bacterium]|nr:DUF302 domain-containing protein [Candidatus Neomarinimicrobiota bacterium]
MRNSTIIMVELLAVIVMATTGLRAQEHDMSKMMHLPESQAMVASAYDFTDTVELLTAAIEEQNLMVIKEIDAQKMLKMVNKKVGGMKQLLFFHPRYMKMIMEANPMGTIEPPLKIAVMERPDGQVMVKYIKPSALLGKYSGLEEIGKELDEIVTQITDSVRK